jgi:hypothetical protein
MSAEPLEKTRPAVIDRRYNAIFSHVLTPWAIICRRSAAVMGKVSATHGDPLQIHNQQNCGNSIESSGPAVRDRRYSNQTEPLPRQKDVSGKFMVS